MYMYIHVPMKGYVILQVPPEVRVVNVRLRLEHWVRVKVQAPPMYRYSTCTDYPIEGLRNIIIIPRPHIACGRDTVIVVLVS